MPTPRDLAEALVALDRFSREITRTASTTLGLPGNVEIQILMGVHFRPGITPGAISAATGVRGPAVSRTLGLLEQEGHIVRVPAPFDGRTSQVRLTRKGRARIARFDAAIADLLRAEPSPVAPVLALIGDSGDDLGESISGLDAAIALSRVGAALVSDITEVVAPHGIDDFAARSAVTLIGLRGAVRPTQLGAELDLSGSSASELLTRLEAARLVYRRHDDPHDRRAVTVRLTPRGKRAADAVLTVFSRHVADIAAALRLARHTSVEDGAAIA